MSYPRIFSVPGVGDFAEEIDAERRRQITKFGDQLDLPDGTGRIGDRNTADYYRDACQRAADSGVLTDRDVLLEEVYEAMAESDPALLRAELIQVAAVCAKWIYKIDHREGS